VRERWRVAILDSGLRDGSVLDPQSSIGATGLGDPLATRGSVSRSGPVAVLGPATALNPVVAFNSAVARGAAPGRNLAPVPAPFASCRFIDDGCEVLCAPVIPDPLGHGTAVAQVICGSVPTTRNCDLFVGQVLDHRGVTTAAALAAAINWSVREGANLIHMSLGLREDRQILAEAVSAAIAAGCIIVASTPARGEGTYPARYDGVIRATGDARCQWDEISDLHSAQADFGGCPRYASAPASSDQARLGGASLGAAHVTRFLVANIAPRLEAIAVRTQLRAGARYTGVEDRCFKAT
jgi:hypothetical protein